MSIIGISICLIGVYLPLEEIGTGLIGLTIGSVGTYTYLNSRVKTDEIQKVLNNLLYMKNQSSEIQKYIKRYSCYYYISTK